MTVNQLITHLNPQVLSLPEGWVTIMSNINVPAVASLADVSCVIIGENARPEDDVIAMAEARGVNILLMPDSAYDICIKLSKIL